MNKIELHESELIAPPQWPQQGTFWYHQVRDEVYLCKREAILVSLKTGDHWDSKGGFGGRESEFRRITKPFTITPDCDE